MNRSTLITLGLFIGAFLVLWFGVWGTYTNVSESQDISQALAQVLERERDAAARIDRQGEVLSEYAENLERIEQALPVQQDTAAFIAVLEEAASSRGLVLENINVISEAPTRGAAPTEQVRGARSFSMQVTLIGTYVGARGMLRDLERSFPLLDVSTVSIGAESGISDLLSNPDLDIQITFDAYYLPVQ